MESMNIKNREKGRVGRIISFIFSFLFLAVAIWVVLNRQLVVDQITVWQFQPSSQISQLASDSGMNDTGRFLYYASRPELNDRSNFNQNCTTRETQSIVLGCYVDNRIYLFDVTDDRISGIRSVVAAHEMLHAAYQRLSDSERSTINKMLEQQLSETKDKNILDTVEIYNRIEPGEKLNELHSLFATETQNLSPDLENYYRKYFSDRGKVIEIYQKYSQVFNDLETKAANLQKNLKSQKSNIDMLTANYESQQKTLISDISSFNERAKSVGGFASQSVFDEARKDLVDRQNSLKTMTVKINGLINEYNSSINDLNALGIEIAKLNENLKSTDQQIR